MPAGTAPRRVSPGVWRTRTGRTLTPDGGAYWENLFRTGHTDGKGHMRTPSVVQTALPAGIPLGPGTIMTNRVPVPRKPMPGPDKQTNFPGFSPYAGGPGTRSVKQTAQQRRQAVQYRRHQQEAAARDAWVQQHTDARFGNVIPLARQANPTINPAVGNVLTAISPLTAAQETLTALKHHRPLAAGIAAMGIVPFGPGKGVKLVKAGEKAVEAGRAAERVAPYVSKGQDYVPGIVDAAREPGYLYHRTEVSNLKNITSQGLHPRQPTGTNPAGVYFGNEPLQAGGLSQKSQKGAVYLRVAKDKVPGLTERSFGESVTPQRIPPGDLEYLGADGGWHPVAPSAQEQVHEASQAAKRLLPAQRALHSAERSRRAAKLGPAHEAAGGGEAGFYAKKAALKKELPTLTFKALTGLDRKVMNELHDAVDALPDFQPYEKIGLHEALDRAKAGRPFRPFEVKLIERAFGPKAAEEAQSTIGLRQQLLTGVEEVVNIPRALMSSVDVSHLLRQGLLFAAHDPKAWAKTVGPSFHMLASEGKYQDVQRLIEASPTYDDKIRSGLKLTGLNDLGNREEAFMSNFAEKATGVGPLFAKPGERRAAIGKGSFVRMSGRAYTGGLDLMRDGGWDNIVDGARAAGVPEEEMQHLMESASRFINVATGRGGLGRLEPIAKELSTVLFSPRLMASRFQIFNPFFYSSLHPYVRKQALMATLKMVSAGTTILALAALAGAKVVTDPRNSDWGKIRIGNTRFDIWGGFQQYARLAAQVQQGEIVSSTTGKKLRLTGGHNLSRLDIIIRFGLGKFAPTPSMIVDAFKGTDFAGKPFSWKKAVYSRMYPLLIQDAIDTAHQQGAPWAGVAAFGVGAFGVGVQSYGPKATPGGTGPVWGGSRGGGNFDRPSEPAVWGAGR